MWTPRKLQEAWERISMRNLRQLNLRGVNILSQRLMSQSSHRRKVLTPVPRNSTLLLSKTGIDWSKNVKVMRLNQTTVRTQVSQLLTSTPTFITSTRKRNRTPGTRSRATPKSSHLLSRCILRRSKRWLLKHPNPQQCSKPPWFLSFRSRQKSWLSLRRLQLHLQLRLQSRKSEFNHESWMDQSRHMHKVLSSSFLLLFKRRITNGSPTLSSMLNVKALETRSTSSGMNKWLLNSLIQNEIINRFTNTL